MLLTAPLTAPAQEATAAPIDIMVVQPADYPHAAAFAEVAETLRCGLRRLGHAAQLAEGRRIDDMTVRELVDRISAIGEPHIVEVVARGGIGCAIAG